MKITEEPPKTEGTEVPKPESEAQPQPATEATQPPKTEEAPKVEEQHIEISEEKKDEKLPTLNEAITE
jgi:hypothetical protein